ncbi:hypothetical protein RF55_19170 [Lasius niger]|uniref:Uncharacterized protein n=1 Tax=Lasius niger TaxID=67767 RepID=A0A0J7K0B5_LASNI|nr:hypothetical protein RF55_19170 [Lasius niger]
MASSAGQSGQERICQREIHRQRHANQEARIDQTDDQEHPALQHRDQLRLAGARLQKLRTQDTDANTGAQRTQADDDACTQGGVGLDEGDELLHVTLLTDKEKTKNDGKG